MKSDIEIAHEAQPQKIWEIAKSIGLSEEQVEPYGKYKAKISGVTINPKGKLILVTAMTPTKQGDGKTTVSIGLADALRQIGKKSILALREPSLGPVFGMKGGAAGGGYSQVIPMEDINLHFTGDFHAITSANNLLCAVIDNHIQQGNALGIDPRSISVKRCLDMNDRALRNVVIGLGGKSNGMPREDHFCITVATEIMAIFCLSKDLDELKAGLEKIQIGKSFSGQELYVKDLKIAGAMAALLKDAIQPNLVQTIEGTPAFIHGGPFANIAHGCNSIAATLTALTLGDYVVTEAGFASDLGAEKFIDIKCRRAGIRPACTILVATIKAMKLHGNGDMCSGFANLKKHYDNLTLRFGVNVVVALNKFGYDTDEDLADFARLCKENNMQFALSCGFAEGGKGCIDLAEKAVAACEKTSELHFLYEAEESISAKINSIATKLYGARGVIYTDTAAKKIAALTPEQTRFNVCMAKTQYSLSDNPKLLNVPEDFEITVRDIEVKCGCGFIVVLLGDIMTMPGLPKKPNAELMDVLNGEITGLS